MSQLERATMLEAKAIEASAMFLQLFPGRNTRTLYDNKRIWLSMVLLAWMKLGITNVSRFYQIDVTSQPGSYIVSDSCPDDDYLFLVHILPGNDELDIRDSTFADLVERVVSSIQNHSQVLTYTSTSHWNPELHLQSVVDIVYRYFIGRPDGFFIQATRNHEPQFNIFTQLPIEIQLQTLDNLDILEADRVVQEQYPHLAERWLCSLPARFVQWANHLFSASNIRSAGYLNENIFSHSRASGNSMHRLSTEIYRFKSLDLHPDTDFQPLEPRWQRTSQELNGDYAPFDMTAYSQNLFFALHTIYEQRHEFRQHPDFQGYPYFENPLSEFTRLEIVSVKILIGYMHGSNSNGHLVPVYHYFTRELVLFSDELDIILDHFELVMRQSRYIEQPYIQENLTSVSKLVGFLKTLGVFELALKTDARRKAAARLEEEVKIRAWRRILGRRKRAWSERPSARPVTDVGRKRAWSLDPKRIWSDW